MVRVGLFTGHIYQDSVDRENIKECCRMFSNEEKAKEYAETAFFPNYKCHNCINCETAQSQK